jgi:hypothetical protein
MPQADYIGYKSSVGDIASSGVAFAKTLTSSGPKALASGGADIGADIALLASGGLFISNLIDQWTSHPAADARDFIKNLKPTIVNVNSYERMKRVIVGDQKINERAKDVSARELVLWYRQNYPNDYMSLTADQKIYFNTYVKNRASLYPQNVNQIAENYKNSQFTNTEINYNATPIQSVTNLFSTGTGKTNWVLYGAIGLGVILLIKMLKK